VQFRNPQWPVTVAVGVGGIQTCGPGPRGRLRRGPSAQPDAAPAAAQHDSSSEKMSSSAFRLVGDTVQHRLECVGVIFFEHGERAGQLSIQVRLAGSGRRFVSPRSQPSNRRSSGRTRATNTLPTRAVFRPGHHVTQGELQERTASRRTVHRSRPLAAGQARSLPRPDRPSQVRGRTPAVLAADFAAREFSCAPPRRG